MEIKSGDVYKTASRTYVVLETEDHRWYAHWCHHDCLVKIGYQDTLAIYVDGDIRLGNISEGLRNFHEAIKEGVK